MLGCVSCDVVDERWTQDRYVLWLRIKCGLWAMNSATTLCLLRTSHFFLKRCSHKIIFFLRKIQLFCYETLSFVFYSSCSVCVQIIAWYHDIIGFSWISSHNVDRYRKSVDQVAACYMWLGVSCSCCICPFAACFKCATTENEVESNHWNVRSIGSSKFK